MVGVVKAELVIELELAAGADELSDDALDAWAWSVEKQLEELELVQSASVSTATFDRAPS